MSTSRLFTRGFTLLIGAQFLQSLGYASMILLPLYLEFLGANRAQIGAIMGTAAIGGLTFRPLVAWALDSVGRKPTLLVGTAVLAAGVAAIGLIDHIGPALYAVRAVIGVGIGTLFTGYFTLASDHIPEARRTEGLALFGIFGLLGLLVNPAAEALGVEGAALRTFFPMIAAVIAASGLVLVLVPEQHRVPVKGSDASFGAARAFRAMGARSMRPVWVATTVFSTLVATYMAFATVSAAAAGVARPSLLWLTYTLGAVSVRAFGARLPDRIGPSNLVAPALACYAIALLLAASGGAFALSGLLAGLGHGYCFPVLSSQVVTRMPRHLTGTGLAAFTGLWELARLLLTPLFGIVADRYDDATMFSAVAVFALAGLALWALLEARDAPDAMLERGGGRASGLSSGARRPTICARLRRKE